ncbi:O-antigen ligase family protein [Pseudarthrobacter sp. efr-133-R2A-89]|uniref:O-antigen ligase family protein n=1 Tax=Pseudarthrobacter sp. efr-133-R2A-89 TaxID=3040302 RepID=UPI002557B7C4|nr:O-antigen ligase family protein [Pseudarthrobacter sp. efr-133-R2A-89]
MLAIAVLAVVKPILVLAVPVVAAFVYFIIRPGAGVYALVGMLFFTPVTINLGWPGQASTYVFYASLALAILGRIVRALTRKQKLSEAAWILLFLLPIMLTGLVHDTSFGGWFTNAKPLLVLVVVSWHVVAEARLDPQRIRRAALMVAWAAPALFLLAAFQRIAGYWPVLDQYAIARSYTSRGDAARSAAIMGHSILYGGYCMVTAVISAVLTPKWWKVLLTVSLGGLLLTGARSAWLAAAVALLIVFVIRRPKISFWGLYAGLLGLCALVLAMTSFPHAVDEVVAAASGRLENFAESASALARQLRVDLAWRQIAHTEFSWWWGLGPGALVAYFTVTKTADNLAATFDNSYLTLWYDYGVIPVVLFAVVLLAMILRKGPMLGRVLTLGIATQILFFDFYQWPLMIGAIALAAGLRQGVVAPPPEASLHPVTTPVRISGRPRSLSRSRHQM